MRRLAPLLAALSLVSTAALAGIPIEGDPMILVFYEEGCPACEEVELLIRELVIDLPPEAIVRLEIGDPDNFDLLTSLGAAYGIEVDTVPVVFAGDEAIVGEGRASEFALRAAIGVCATRGCPTPLARIRPPEFPWADVARLAAFAAAIAILLLLQPI